MSYDHTDKTPATTPTIQPPSVSPGKRTHTDRIPGKPRDADYETICDGAADDEPDCGLSPEMRGRALAELGDGVGNAMANYRDAIQDERIELLTSEETSWGFLAEVLFYSATGPLVAIGTRAVMRYASVAAARALERGHAAGSDALKRAGGRLARASVGKVNEDRVRGALTNASRGLRTTLKGLAHSGAGNHGKAIFLQAMRAQISTMRLTIREEARDMTDVELQAFAAGYDDVEVHSVESYRVAIAELLARYDANHIPEIGTGGRVRANKFPSGDERPDRRYESIQHGRLAWTTLGRTRRLALLSYVDDERSFRHYIDQDFEEVAVGVYLERTGKRPDEIALDGTQTNGATACPWAASARLSLAWCVDGNVRP